MRRWLSTLFALSALACATTGVVDSALHGDLQTLKREIRNSQKSGDLDRSTVEKLARAVAGREVRSATGAKATKRIRQVRPCAGQLSAVLGERAERHDEAGAEASLALLEAGKLQAAPLLERHASASQGAWRAVAARAAVRRPDGPLRRRFISDPDQRVRRAALRAAGEARDPADVEELLEAARLDPDPLARSLAMQAAGAIGGDRVVLGLRDLWPAADQQERMALVEAWSRRAAFRSGGAGQLVRVLETSGGLPAIAAAGALARQGSGELASLGVAVLERSIAEGTLPERRLALRIAPIDKPDSLKAIQRAAEDDDQHVRVMALARLASLPGERDAAQQELRKLSKSKGQLAVQARAALAAANDESVATALEQQLGAPSSEHRRLAALGLIRLGDWSRAATALGDDDADVRTRFACAVLSQR